MTHDLRRQLKDAGFKNQEREACYISTLEELIEACGDDFFELTRYVIRFTEGPDQVHWSARSLRLKDTLRGDTAEEAVARLWLALHAVK